MRLLVVYDWPQSQICMECKHSRFLADEFATAAYECQVSCRFNDGVRCPLKEESQEHWFDNLDQLFKLIGEN